MRRRFTYGRNKVIDLGLRLADIEDLEREEVQVSSPSKIDRRRPKMQPTFSGRARGRRGIRLSWF